MIINLTPHSIEIFSEANFVGLEQVNPTTWVADSVTGEPIASFESRGCLRIATETIDVSAVDGIPLMAKKYGDVTGIPAFVTEDDLLIVSLAARSMAASANHLLASRMVSPYKVVRSRSNGSTVLGAMGLSY